MPNVACPCCRFLTLSRRGRYELCPVCFWIDDGTDVAAVPIARAKDGGVLTLAEARRNFDTFGASELAARPYVRDPRREEFPPRG